MQLVYIFQMWLKCIHRILCYICKPYNFHTPDSIWNFHLTLHTVLSLQLIAVSSNNVLQKRSLMFVLMTTLINKFIIPEFVASHNALEFCID